MEELIRITFDESFVETLEKMPKFSDGMCLGEKIYEFSYQWFMEGMRAGIEIMGREEE